MKRIIILIYTFLMIFAANVTWAHDESEELGHHWDLPIYIHEIHIQVAAMATLAGIVLISPIIVRRLKNRGARQ